MNTEDSLEKIKEDATKPFYQYWNCANADDCMNCCISCNSKIDGKRPSEYYKTGCQYAMNLDIIERTVKVMENRVERTCKNLSSGSLFVCSECTGQVTQWNVTPNYCPNCGARVVL